MRTRGLSRFAGVLSLVALSVGMAVSPPPAFASCVSDWRQCRDRADRAFIRGDVNEYGYALRLSGCDLLIIVCWGTSKEKENGK